MYIIRRVAHGGSRQKRSSSGEPSTRGRDWQTMGNCTMGKQPRTRGAGSRREPKKKGEGRSPDQTALRDSGGSRAQEPLGERARAEWETGRRALVGAKPRDQPRTGAKRGRRTRRGARSTANDGATEHMNRLSQKTMLGARARAAATRKQGSPKIKAVARRGRAKPAPVGQGLSAPRRLEPVGFTSMRVPEGAKRSEAPEGCCG